MCVSEYECGRDIRFADGHKLSGQVSGEWVSEGKPGLTHGMRLFVELRPESSLTLLDPYGPCHHGSNGMNG